MTISGWGELSVNRLFYTWGGGHVCCKLNLSLKVLLSPTLLSWFCHIESGSGSGSDHPNKWLPLWDAAMPPGSVRCHTDTRISVLADTDTSTRHNRTIFFSACYSRRCILDKK